MATTKADRDERPDNDGARQRHGSLPEQRRDRGQPAARSGDTVPPPAAADVGRVGAAGAGRVHRDAPADGRAAARREPVDRHRADRVHGQPGADVHRVSAPGRRAGGAARRRRGGEDRLHQHRPQAAAGRDGAQPADAHAAAGGHRQPYGGRRRLRAGDSARRGHLLRGRPAPAGGHLGGLRRRVRRLLGQLHPVGARSAAAGLHAVGGADPRPRTAGQPALQPGVHRRVVAARGRGGLVPDRPRDRAAAAGDRHRRRSGRHAEDGAGDGRRPARLPGRRGRAGGGAPPAAGGRAAGRFAPARRRRLADQRRGAADGHADTAHLRPVHHSRAWCTATSPAR